MEALFKAMAAAFPKIEGATKANENDGFKRNGKATKYADLSSVVDAIKPALQENKLFFYQMTHEQQGGVCIETVVGHESGQQLSFGKLFVPASKQDAHGYGSALTYARRYSLMAAFGVCPEDDDGNAAAKAAQEPMITPAQEIELQDLARDVGADEKKFFAWANVAAWSEIPAKDFGAAKKALEAKRKAKPKADPQASDELNDTIPHMEAQS